MVGRTEARRRPGAERRRIGLDDSGPVTVQDGAPTSRVGLTPGRHRSTRRTTLRRKTPKDEGTKTLVL